MTWVKKNGERREKMNKQEENNLDFLETEAPKEIKFYAAGVQFREGWRENLMDLEEGEELFLVAEPTNKYDPNAVQILSRAKIFLGYVPAKKGNEKNLWVVERLEEGKQLKAVILEVNPEAKPYQALLVEITLIEVGGEKEK
jgi:hypothetical protein